MTPFDDELAKEVVGPDEDVLTAEFIAFLKAASRRRRNGPMLRFNQGKAGAAWKPNSPSKTSFPRSIGSAWFAEPRIYPAFIRFASASSTQRSRAGRPGHVHRCDDSGWRESDARRRPRTTSCSTAIR